MKVLVRRNSNTKTGYELVTIDNEGKEVSIAINNTDPANPTILKLPENSSNRKWFSIKKVEAAGGEIELTYKESKTIGPRTESTPRKGLEEYLEGKDKEMYLALVEKAKKAREEANKKAPMTDLEKAMRAVDRAQARLAELQAKENA